MGMVCQFCKGTGQKPKARVRRRRVTKVKGKVIRTRYAPIDQFLRDLGF
ncbi:MAG: hypothetical protein P3W93_003680 [Thermus sp.]|nr:hypothetical protein [Thermus sp.]